MLAIYVTFIRLRLLASWGDQYCGGGWDILAIFRITSDIYIIKSKTFSKFRKIFQEIFRKMDQI